MDYGKGDMRCVVVQSRVPRMLTALLPCGDATDCDTTNRGFEFIRRGMVRDLALRLALTVG